MFSKRVYLRKENREESLCKIDVYVVNSAKKYIEYGKTWS
jgi:hypothetical protein|tara:strand:+ start:612 stop:731 length:120 start_codon:yes stop_codon:yes gene_type:complete